MTVWAMPPEQFWKLHPVEFWWLVDARRPSAAQGFSEDELQEMYTVAMFGLEAV